MTRNQKNITQWPLSMDCISNRAIIHYPTRYPSISTTRLYARYCQLWTRTKFYLVNGLCFISYNFEELQRTMFQVASAHRVDLRDNKSNKWWYLKTQLVHLSNKSPILTIRDLQGNQNKIISYILSHENYLQARIYKKGLNKLKMHSELWYIRGSITSKFWD
jgi:hypothetical protein